LGKLDISSKDDQIYMEGRLFGSESGRHDDYDCIYNQTWYPI